MSNTITTLMFIKGPQTTVDQFIWTGIEGCKPVPPGVDQRQWRIEHWNTRSIFNKPEVAVIEETDDWKLVRYSFDCASDPAVKLYEAAIEQYHEAGLRFFSQWLDQDRCFILPDSDDYPLHPALEPYAGEIVYSRFGEVYSEMIDHPACKSDFSAEQGARYAKGHITYVFAKSECDGDDANEYLVSSVQGVVECKTLIDYSKLPEPRELGLVRERYRALHQRKQRQEPRTSY